jgi:chemotaxis protein histidine kinase CheA
MAGQVFISYSRRDDAAMRRVVAFLRKQGVNVWVDNEKLVPGTPIWEEEIEKAIHSASAVVVVLSPDSKRSVWVRREISLAERYQKRLFPVMVAGDEDSSITLRLITSQYVDIRENEETGLNALSTALSFYLDELEKQENAAREKAEREVAEKAAKEKTERQRKERERLEHEEKVRKEKEAAEIAAKEEAAEKAERERKESERLEREEKARKEKETAEPAIREKTESQRVEKRKANGEQKVKKGVKHHEKREVIPFLIDVSWIQSKWFSILLIAFGWAISGVVGGSVTNLLEDNFTGWNLRLISVLIGFSIGLPIGGCITALILRREQIILHRKEIFWIISSWVIGGIIGGIIGFDLPSDFAYRINTPFGFATIFIFGLPIGFSTGGAILTLILKRKKIATHKKGMLWVTFSWAIAGVIGGVIYYLVDLSTGFSFSSLSFTWSIIEAFCGAIGGFVLVWQIRSTENVSQEKVEPNATEKTISLTKQNTIEFLQNGLYQTWQGRILLGGLIGIVISFYYGSQTSDYVDHAIVFIYACSLAGLITYPHKLSVVLLIIGFLVTGFISEPDLYLMTRFTTAGGFFGIPAGALLSRIFHWIKVLK